MSKSIQQILGYQSLCGIIQNPKGGIPADVLPPEFFSITKPVVGNTGTYTRVQGNRQVATIVAYGSPSQRRELKGLSEIPVVLLHTHEHIYHPVEVLNALRNYDSPAVQQQGMTIVAQRVGEFKGLFSNLRLASVYSAFGNGKVWFNGAGQLLPNSTGATLTIDYGIPANQLDNTGIGAWNTTSTDIAAQLLGWDNTCERGTGYFPEICLYGKNLLGYLAKNDNVKTLMSSNNAVQNAFLNNRIPDGLFNKRWIPFRRAFFADSTDTNQGIFGDNSLAIIPAPDRTWWEVLEGTYQVPTRLSVHTDMADALDAFATVQGMFSYAKITDDPAGIKHNAGDTFLPVIKVPGAVRIVSDVTQAAT